MATPITPIPTPVAFKFELDKAQAHINAVKENLFKFAGKHNHNPFKWISDNVAPLEARLAKEERTETLFKDIMALDIDAKPVINIKLADVPEGTNASVQPTNKMPEPKGLTLK